MANRIKIASWNCNGLMQHILELQTFLKSHNIDVMLLSETHLTERSFVKIPQYHTYNTNHPSGSARGGTAIMVRQSIVHQVQEEFKEDYLQASVVTVHDRYEILTLASVYFPPKHTVKQHQFQNFFNRLGSKFIAGGDYNAKHVQWGSRLSTPKGRELFKTMQANNLSYLSTGEPTYWPSDRNKSPDLVDYFVLKGISSNYTTIKSSFELSSDHSPIIMELRSNINLKRKPASLHNHKTNWANFRNILDDTLNLNIPLKRNYDLDQAVEILNDTIQQAAWNSTPKIQLNARTPIISRQIQYQIATKRKLRKIWQVTRNPLDKKNLNKATKNLKQALKEEKNHDIQRQLSKLTGTKATNYSLYKTTAKLKQPQAHIPPIKMRNGEWAKTDKEKAQTFASHLCEVFTPYPASVQETEIYQFLEAPGQLEMPIKKFKIQDIKKMIDKINPRKSPGYDLITGKVLKELPTKALKFLLQIFNGVLRLGHFPIQWKVAQIIVLSKPGKPLNEVESYRPISLLPIISKIFEKLLLSRLSPILLKEKLIPDHQFGFRQQHATIEQVHRVYKVARNALENKMYATAVFLDISQAFDKVWHTGLLYKLKRSLPDTYYTLLKSYLESRHFMVKFNDEVSNLNIIKSGVPQGSVLGPVLYTLFTADLPISENTHVATFADDSVFIAVHQIPTVASKHLQNNLNQVQKWLQTWRIKANETKSAQITFTLRKDTCPAVSLYDQKIPQATEVKYLGVYLDRRLTWQKHIFTKRKQLGLQVRNMFWLLNGKSQLSLENKLLVYKVILMPVWTYSIQLWGTASKSNIDILQRFQSKMLRIIANAPRYVTNEAIHRDLNMPTVQQVIKKYSDSYLRRLYLHPNALATNLMSTAGDLRRLKRLQPADLL